MARLIDADELVSKINKLDIFYFIGETDIAVHDCQMVELGAVLSEIDEAPTVDAVPVVHGRWVLIEEGQNTSVYQCSKCNRMVNVVCDRNLRKRQLAKNYPYCNCGAKMDLEDE